LYFSATVPQTALWLGGACLFLSLFLLPPLTHRKMAMDAVGSLAHLHKIVLSWDYWKLTEKVGMTFVHVCFGPVQHSIICLMPLMRVLWAHQFNSFGGWNAE
jgi:hypothetical protein